VPDPRPKKRLPREIDIRSLARSYTTACISALGVYATQEETEADVRLRAIGMLMDRGWGKPESTTTTKHEGGESPIEFIIRNLNAEKKK
jgi:hypothetical protein